MARPKGRIDTKNNAKAEIAWRLFVLGLSMADISPQVKVSTTTLEVWAKGRNWVATRDKLYAERNEKLGAKVLKEQESIRGMERDFAEKLMAAATLALKHFKPEKCKPGDLVKILDLATKLGRLSVGLPLGTTNVDVAVRHDLGDSIKAALEKVYGSETQSLVVNNIPPIVVESQVSLLTEHNSVIPFKSDT